MQHNRSEPERTGYETAAFRPAPWLTNRHVQTLGGRALRWAARCRYRRERIELADGDFVDLDHASPAVGRPRTSAGPGDPFVLVLHGLEGSSSSGYVQLTCRLLAASGVRAVALNFRGCSGQLNRLARSYHSGETGDLNTVLEILARRDPESDCGIIGYSLGGNVLLKYLGERGRSVDPRIRCAVAVSVPFDLAASARCLERGMGHLYSGYFLRSLRAKTRRKARRYPDRFDRAAIRAARTLWTFDDVVTAPLHGFRDAEDYYRQCSSRRFLAGVHVRTLLLQAIDDPFVPSLSLPHEELAANPHLLPGFQPRGGHLGFLRRGLRPARACWAEAEAVRFAVGCLESDGRSR